MSSFGYRGKVLHVDLIAQQAWIEEPDDRLKYPERFAAIVPIASGGDPEKACLSKIFPYGLFMARRTMSSFPKNPRRWSRR